MAVVENDFSGFYADQMFWTAAPEDYVWCQDVPYGGLWNCGANPWPQQSRNCRQAQHMNPDHHYHQPTLNLKRSSAQKAAARWAAEEVHQQPTSPPSPSTPATPAPPSLYDGGAAAALGSEVKTPPVAVASTKAETSAPEACCEKAPAAPAPPKLPLLCQRLRVAGEPREEGDVELCDERVVEALAATLEHLVSLAPQQQAMTSFHSRAVPGMTITQYIKRLRAYFGCSLECYVVALVYMDRLIKRNPIIVVSALSCHRLMITSLVLAAKFQDDVFYGNRCTVQS
mmetsp:Transcript_38332/g.109986  ORF Transcript_38332/g.109986 Transcript_38332/m.109986 type:complete len:285 (+) Transcript_38332:55-909(+)